MHDRKSEIWPIYFPQKNPQAVDKPVDNLCILDLGQLEIV
jgi:hypothetical protein